ncbi:MULTISPECIES: hypothetical protein [unclassified Providencia]|uniref:hypothetical protein n=1 Tax=unclassified Providencia TaxID=2633465 RepID=UPI00234ADB89|nr:MULTISPECIES: hypothetical protein [unclassified Providencia]
MKYCSVGTVGQRYFELLHILQQLELMPVVTTFCLLLIRNVGIAANDSYPSRLIAIY